MMRALIHLLYGKPQSNRSPRWSTERRIHLRNESQCQWCGGILLLEVHHIDPFVHNPARELDQENMITLCEFPGRMCHLHKGHKGNWHTWDPNIRRKCVKHKNEVTR